MSRSLPARLPLTTGPTAATSFMPPNNSMEPTRFASRITLKGPGIFDRSRPAECLAFMRY